MNETKEYILKTSLFLFLQKSYKDVTMKEIVEKTGLSKGAFYHYFTSKEELFREIVMMFFSFGSVSYETFNKDSLQQFYISYVESLNGFFIKMNADLQEETNGKSSLNFFFIMFEAINRFPEFLNIELEMHNKDVEEWEKVIFASRKTGEIKSESSDEEIANLFLYLTDGVFIRFINNNNKKSFKDYLLSVFNTVYNNLKV